MPFQTASFFLLASVFCSYTAAFTDEALDCCLSTSDARVPHQIVASFSIQTTQGGCPIPATVFFTKKGRGLCAPPADGDNWVSKVICRVSPTEPGCRPPKKPQRKQQRKRRHGAKQ